MEKSSVIAYLNELSVKDLTSLLKEVVEIEGIETLEDRITTLELENEDLRDRLSCFVDNAYD